MKKLKKSLALLVAFMMMFTCLVACEEKKDETSTEVEGSAATSVTAYPLELTDSYGNVVVIEKEPEKIVSCAPNITEMIFELGAGDRLVGRTDYCDYPSEVADISSVGLIDNPDLEMIISLEPDVVIATTFSDEGIATLKSAGIPVLVFHEEGTVDGVYTMISNMGKVLNLNQEANLIIEEMKTSLAEVSEKIEGMESPTVYYVVGYGEYGDYTAGGDTFVGGLLELAGGDNIAKGISGWNISLETLIEKDPEIIIISEYIKDDFMSAPHYCDLTAVKEGRVYTIDTNMLERQGVRNDEAVLELAKIFYPEAFK